ncbi:hypothetical protein SARC_18142, partial [Sphaeroforma arctica JP610]
PSTDNTQLEVAYDPGSPTITLNDSHTPVVVDGYYNTPHSHDAETSYYDGPHSPRPLPDIPMEEVERMWISNG